MRPWSVWVIFIKCRVIFYIYYISIFCFYKANLYKYIEILTYLPIKRKRIKQIKTIGYLDIFKLPEKKMYNKLCNETEIKFNPRFCSAYTGDHLGNYKIKAASRRKMAEKHCGIKITPSMNNTKINNLIRKKEIEYIKNPGNIPEIKYII